MEKGRRIRSLLHYVYHADSKLLVAHFQDLSSKPKLASDLARVASSTVLVSVNWLCLFSLPITTTDTLRHTHTKHAHKDTAAQLVGDCHSHQHSHPAQKHLIRPFEHFAHLACHLTIRAGHESRT